MKQKFRMLSFVHVCKEMPVDMQHFPYDFDAIIKGSYSQLYGGNNLESYSLYKIKDGKVSGESSWYRENQLTLLPSQNRYKAEKMIEVYNLRELH
jgi:hypothetical protein